MALLCRDAGGSGQCRRLSEGETRRCPDADGRIGVGLAVHGAELSIFSGFARLIPTLVASRDSFSDALFEAEDAHTWRALLATGGVTQDSGSSETSYPIALLAQAIVQVHQHRELGQTLLGDTMPLQTHATFFGYMMALAEELHLLPLSGGPSMLVALWHYVFVVRLAPLTLIEEAAGRAGEPSSDCLAELRSWVGSPAARLATLHCGRVLLHAADLRDKSFLLPR